MASIRTGNPRSTRKQRQEIAPAYTGGSCFPRLSTLKLAPKTGGEILGASLNYEQITTLRKNSKLLQVAGILKDRFENADDLLNTGVVAYNKLCSECEVEFRDICIQGRFAANPEAEMEHDTPALVAVDFARPGGYDAGDMFMSEAFGYEPAITRAILGGLFMLNSPGSLPLTTETYPWQYFQDAYDNDPLEERLEQALPAEKEEIIEDHVRWQKELEFFSRKSDKKLLKPYKDDVNRVLRSRKPELAKLKNWLLSCKYIGDSQDSEGYLISKEGLEWAEDTDFRQDEMFVIHWSHNSLLFDEHTQFMEMSAQSGQGYLPFGRELIVTERGVITDTRDSDVITWTQHLGNVFNNQIKDLHESYDEKRLYAQLKKLQTW